METKNISTSALAKKYNVPIKEMFAILQQEGMIEKKGDVWSLTNLGIKKGGKFVKSKKYGKYITWPENIKIIHNVQPSISATLIGKHFSLSPVKINYILYELGWIQKVLKGWKVTLQGERKGGLQYEDKKTGIPYVKWPYSILEDNFFVETINEFKGIQTGNKIKCEDKKTEFRQKFPAEHRATDGHFVRSKSEMLIDNWLYMAGIAHAYERKLPIEENVYCDFYIPAGNVYIEYWGYENNEKYINRKKIKQEIYKKYEFNLIELSEEEVKNLDDILPKMLLKYNIQAY